MLKAMISQPMKGRTKEEILRVKEKAVKSLNEKGYEVINTYFEDFDESNFKNKPLAYLAKSLEAMATVDCVYFCKGWEKTRGCILEHHAAIEYGLDVIEDYTNG